MPTWACIFCGTTPTTREDLFPKWLERAYPQDQPRRVVLETEGEETASYYTRTPAFVKCKVVCEVCNTTWMSQIENRLKPTIKTVLEGETVTLTQAEQVDLGLWATMKAYVLDADLERSFVSQDERDILFGEKRPPANVRVFLAVYASPGTFRVDRWYASGYRKVGDTEVESAHATTLILNHLVVQVLGATATDYRAFEDYGIANDWMSTIVPPVFAGAVWPPKHAMATDADIEEFGSGHFVFGDEASDSTGSTGS